MTTCTESSVPPLFDSQILRFDDDLQVEARTVISHSPEPQNVFEVAVIMETLGHTDATAQARGYDDLFDLARHLHEMLGETSYAHANEPGVALGPTSEPFELAEVVSLFIGQSLPWLTAIVLLFVLRTSFWSSALFSPNQSAVMVLALSAGLVTSALFTFPFGRRATFYRLQSNRALVSWTARWFLGVGAATCVVVMLVLYFLLERVLRAYTPATTRAFFEMGVAIAFLQLALVPLYTLRSYGWLTLATLSGALVLTVGFIRVDHGLFTNAVSVIDVQLLSVTTMVVVALSGSWWLMRSSGSQVSVPRKWAVVRSTGPYAIYGAGFFFLVLTGEFVAGGLWSGQFHYQRDFAVIAGASLLILLPLFGYAALVGERFPRHLVSYLQRLSVSDTDELARDLVAWHRRHLGNLILTGLLVGTAMTLTFELFDQGSGMANLISNHLWLFVGLLSANLAVGMGLLSSQALFALSRPGAPAAGVCVGSAASLIAAGALSVVLPDTSAAVLGLMVGSTSFALIAGRYAFRALRRFDRTYYSAL
jgi:hypothetical protein